MAFPRAGWLPKLPTKPKNRALYEAALAKLDDVVTEAWRSSPKHNPENDPWIVVAAVERTVELTDLLALNNSPEAIDQCGILFAASEAGTEGSGDRDAGGSTVDPGCWLACRLEAGE